MTRAYVSSVFCGSTRLIGANLSHMALLGSKVETTLSSNNIINIHCKIS